MQGSMSIEEYSLKFIILFKYSVSMVSNHRDKMSRFWTGVLDIVKEECRITILYGDMNLSSLMVYAQSI